MQPIASFENVPISNWKLFFFLPFSLYWLIIITFLNFFTPNFFMLWWLCIINSQFWTFSNWWKVAESLNTLFILIWSDLKWTFHWTVCLVGILIWSKMKIAQDCTFLLAHSNIAQSLHCITYQSSFQHLTNST